MPAISKSGFSLPKKVLGLLGSQGICVLIALPMLWQLMRFLSPLFLTNFNIRTILFQASHIAIIAAGVSLVVFVGCIDLSVGSVLSLSGFIGGLVLLNTQSVTLSILVTLAIGCAAGLINGVMVALLRIPLARVRIRIGNRELNPSFIPSLAVTFGMLVFARACTYSISGGIPKGPIPRPALYEWLRDGFLKAIPNLFVTSSIFFIFLAIVLRNTRIDRFIDAANSKGDVSRASRIESGLTTVVAFMFCGGCAGLASIIMTARINSLFPDIGKRFALEAIAAALIGGASIFGGKGHIIATLIGALLVATVTNSISILNLDDSYRSTAMIIIIIIAVAADLVRKLQVTSSE